MSKEIAEIYKSIQELSWRFGNHGFNGECCGDLSLVEFMALKSIRENNQITIQEVGNALNFTKSGASKIIDRLESKGYASREHSPIDGRVCCVSITRKGNETVSTIMKNYTEYLNTVLKEFEPETIQAIGHTLAVLVNALQKNKPFDSTN